MALLGPPSPEAWPPERLFRLLTTRARPRLSLPSLSFAPGISLHVRAMRGAEEMALRDDGAPEHLLDRLIAATLYDGDRPAFSSPDDAGAMLPDDFNELATAVVRAVDVVSPTYVRADAQAWGLALERGAKHASNFSVMLLLAQATDWTSGGEQPDRYYGAPLVELTDGQIMAYRAARDILSEMRKR